MSGRSALRRREEGSILSLTAISLTAILLAAGLAIDVGHWYLVGGELQNAADAAALAAASALDASAGGITQAVERAVTTVNNYEFNGTKAAIARADVRFAATLNAFENGTDLSEEEAKTGGVEVTIKFVKVTVPPKSVGVFFASLATKSSTIKLSRSAVAGLSVRLNRFGNIVPLAFVENRSDAVNPQFLSSPNCGSTGLQYVRGCQYLVQILNGNDAPVGGTAMVLDLKTRSSNGLRERLGLGSDGYVTMGQSLKRFTAGVTREQVSQGLNVRFDLYRANLNAATFPPDANITPDITRAQYRNAAHLTTPSTPGVWDRRVLVVPIITPDQYETGAEVLTPHKFGAFFLTAAASNQALTVEYIGTPTVIGNGGFDPAGEVGAADITTAVLYR
jgi:Flp pilus assembly protein TadG